MGDAYRRLGRRAFIAGVIAAPFAVKRAEQYVDADLAEQLSSELCASIAKRLSSFDFRKLIEVTRVEYRGERLNYPGMANDGAKLVHVWASCDGKEGYAGGFFCNNYAELIAAPKRAYCPKKYRVVFPSGLRSEIEDMLASSRTNC